MAYVLSIDGSPYAFGCSGATTFSGFTSSDSEFVNVTDSTLITGVLVIPSGWSEELFPTDGELRISGITFQIRDIPFSSSIPHGAVYLTTQSAELVSSARLVSILSSSGTTISVLDVERLPNVPTVVWIDREAIYCDARNTGADTLTVASGGRGYYNTNAVAHVLSQPDGYINEVFGVFPWIARRRVCFWYLANDGIAYPLWRGYAQRSPRFVETREGGVCEIQCDHAWTVISQERIGITECSVSLCKFESQAVELSITINETIFGATIERQWNSSTAGNTICNDLISAIQAQTNAAYNRAFNGTSGFIDVSQAPRGVRIYAASTIESFSMACAFGSFKAWGVSTQATDPRFVILEYPSVPTALVSVTLYRSKDYPVSTTRGFPISWTTPVITDGSHTTSLRSVLRGKIGDNKIELRPTTHSSSANTVTASASLVDGEQTKAGTSVMSLVAESPTELRRCESVNSTHWLLGLRRGVIEKEAYGRQFDARDWNFTGNQKAIAATCGALAAVDWTFEGEYSLGDLVSNQCKITGLSLATRSSKLVFVSLAPPTQNQTTVGTISLDTDSDVKFTPISLRWSEQFANTVTLEVPSLQKKVTVTDLRSVARYGSSQAKKIVMYGHPERMTQTDSAETARNTLLSAYLNLYAYDLFLVICRIKVTDLNTYFLGDYVSVSSTILPNGQGSRGFTARVMQIVRKTVSIAADGYVELALLDWSKNYRVSYAPACRIASITTDTAVCDADYVYASGSTTTTDYSGSDQTGYSGTAYDLGVSKFVAGDKVRLIERDNTSPATPESLTVLSVDSATGTVRFTTNPSASWQTLITGGGIVDLVPDVYSTSTTSQRKYAYVGSITAEVIGGTTDYAKRWA